MAWQPMGRRWLNCSRGREGGAQERQGRQGLRERRVTASGTPRGGLAGGVRRGGGHMASAAVAAAAAPAAARRPQDQALRRLTPGRSRAASEAPCAASPCLPATARPAGGGGGESSSPRPPQALGAPMAPLPCLLTLPPACPQHLHARRRDQTLGVAAGEARRQEGPGVRRLCRRLTACPLMLLTHREPLRHGHAAGRARQVCVHKQRHSYGATHAHRHLHCRLQLLGTLAATPCHAATLLLLLLLVLSPPLLHLLTPPLPRRCRRGAALPRWLTR